MAQSSADGGGTFMIGGSVPVRRLGFGAMRVTGDGVWGEPSDGDEARRTLRRVRELGITLVDTADSYGPDVSEELLAEVLHPYGDMLVATKGGLARTGPNVWIPLGRPEYLIQQALKSRRRLRVDRIGLWQLHKIDPKVPRDEQFDAIRTLLDDGVIAGAGLSNVSVAEIEAARRRFPVATVQNRYNLTDRSSEDVLDYCAANGIGFIPWFPLAKGTLARPGSLLDRVAHRHGATPSQIALAWVLKRSPVTLPIPGTGKVAHLEQNVAAATVDLSEAEFTELDEAGRAAARG